MDQQFLIVFLGLSAGVLLGLIVGFFWFSKGKKVSDKMQQQITSKERELQKAESKLSEARNQVKTAEAEARASSKEIIAEAKLQAGEIEGKLEQQSGRLEEKEKQLDEKVQEIERQRASVSKREEDVEELKTELTDASAKHREALESVAKLSQEDAKTQLKEEVESEFSDYFAQQIKLKEKDMDEAYEEKAKNIMAEAMQRYAAEVATESTSTIVQLPSDDVKGKIIGKEGRNITAFEAATGVDIIIDDTPEAIIISGYDLARRYVAKLAMEKLLKDGRIQPARIEEVVEKMKKEVGKMMMEFGKRATEELGITGYPPELLKIIGRLRFRTSYGQNILKHSVEMANIGRVMAEEIGADPQIVVEGCLLHDMGKALDHEVSGTHVEIGVEICKKFKVRDEVTHCVAAHHEDIPIETAEAFVVAAADAISGARPGARRESMEAYIKRLKELEETAKSFEGVHRAFAISAGREIRVYVDTEKINDLEQEKLAKDIAQKIENELTYPGVIKVNVIRERRIEHQAT
ncbi:MAG: ribonuclease Y [Candidatus Peribacteraceae bacterium]|jgi:ribonuclease Y|nr:ribonuclease Y [Candidatus Peribacteraceae bacterium]